MSAAYDSVSFHSAAAIIGPLDSRPALVAPEAPESGIKSVVVSRELSPAERARQFRAVYDAHVAFVWRNLRRLGVMNRDVEDKCQEVFVVAHRRWEEFADRGHGPRAWLFQIVLRVASDARRHRRRHPVDPDGGIAQEANRSRRRRLRRSRASRRSTCSTARSGRSISDAAPCSSSTRSSR